MKPFSKSGNDNMSVCSYVYHVFLLQSWLYLAPSYSSCSVICCSNCSVTKKTSSYSKLQTLDCPCNKWICCYINTLTTQMTSQLKKHLFFLFRNQCSQIYLAKTISNDNEHFTILYLHSFLEEPRVATSHEQIHTPT